MKEWRMAVENDPSLNSILHPHTMRNRRTHPCHGQCQFCRRARSYLS